MRTKAMDFMSKTMHPVASSAVYVLRFWNDEFVVHDVFCEVQYSDIEIDKKCARADHLNCAQQMNLCLNLLVTKL